ncbi:MAG: BrnA antitoxin family protein [Bradyrhizobium sp.]|uniref:BrnA antitoxin family protein n=1 Tax=Bradyrhizobium sp. TaxID=376 RepID=UPI003C7DF836
MRRRRSEAGKLTIVALIISLVSLRLDADVLRWFKRTGAGYQSRIGEVLRRHVHRSAARKKTGRQAGSCSLAPLPAEEAKFQRAKGLTSPSDNNSRVFAARSGAPRGASPARPAAAAITERFR